MVGEERQAAGSEVQENYEAAVLDFLDREMAAVQLAQGGKDPSDELDALVSDLLKQVMTESDQPLGARKSAAGETDDLFLEYTPSQKSTSPSVIKSMPTKTDAAAPRMEDKDEMPADPITPRQDSRSAENGNGQYDSGQEFKCFEEETDPLSEFMMLQEKASAEGRSLDSVLESSQFEDMDAVMAEYMPTQEEAPSIECDPAPLGTEPQFGKFEDMDAPPEDPGPRPENSLRPEENEDKAVVPNPDTASPKAESFQSTKPAEDALKREIQVERPVPSSPAPLKKPEERASAPKALLKKTDSFPTPPLFATPVARKSKTLWIAAALICLMAAVGVPVYFFTDSSNSGSQAEGAAPAAASLTGSASKAAPNGEIPAVPISQVTPKYPELALKNKASTSVVLELSISSEGEVVKATPVSGSQLFYEEAVRAAMKWRFRPASISGANVPSRSRVTLNFNIRN
jgi:TonB family protein